MLPQSTTLGLKAHWILPVISSPIEGGMIALRDHRIVAIGRKLEADHTIDLGDCAIIPGLVNCHTHLEFSHLEKPLLPPGCAFTDWIRAVIAERAGRATRQVGEPTTCGTVRGLAELHRVGTALVGEITTEEPWPQDLIEARTPTMSGVRFLELIGSSATRQYGARQAAQRFLATAAPPGWRAGLSPHAPYTVTLELLESAMRLAAREQRLVAMHLAETREEMELLTSQNGPLRELLEQVGTWREHDIRPGTRLVDYLERLALAPRALVVHGNYLDHASIQFLVAHRDRMSVIYCPRTHAYFQHDRYPLAELMRRGVHVALGTDSRASNPDLSLFEEARTVAHNHLEIDPATVLELATRKGANALSAGKALGGLAVGMSTNLTLVHMPNASRDPLVALFDTSSRVEPLVTYLSRLSEG